MAVSQDSLSIRERIQVNIWMEVADVWKKGAGDKAAMLKCVLPQSLQTLREKSLFCSGRFRHPVLIICAERLPSAALTSKQLLEARIKRNPISMRAEQKSCRL
jgi:hypothetical protein